MNQVRHHRLRGPNRPVRIVGAFLAVVLILGSTFAQSASRLIPNGNAEDLEARFRSPPAEVRVGTFWFWSNSISRAAVTRDLEEMKRVGIGRVVLSPTRNHGGTVEQGGLVFLSPEWLAVFRHALDEAARVGIKVSAVMSNGWYQGGPWVTPELGAQMLVWSQTEISGPAVISQRLAVPDRCREVSRFSRVNPKAKDHLKPVAVLAYRQNDAGELLKDSLVRLDAETTPDATLNWSVPAGKWRVFRFAQAPNFVAMKQDSPGYGGLQIDHLSAAAIDVFFEKVGRPLLAAAGPHVGHTLDRLHEDSIELGHYDWTGDFPAQFQARRHYDLIPWLPVLTGSRFAGLTTKAQVDHDFRLTIDELLTDEHYGRFRDLCHRHGVGLQTEGGDVRGSIPVKGRADFVMGEFWNHKPPSSDLRAAFNRNAVFAAHVYGQNIASFEAFTTAAHWEESPATLKPIADEAFCLGANHLMLHGYSASRLETPRPGDVYFAGTHFDPGVTWWNHADRFFAYLNRCQAMLTAGRSVADVLYIDGSETQAMIQKDEALTQTARFGYDVIPTALIMNQTKILTDGRVGLASGGAYPVLAIANRTMEPELLRRIVELVKGGATLWLHAIPRLAPGWADYPMSQQSIEKSLTDLGADTSPGVHLVGKGRVISGVTDIHEMLAKIGLAPDFQYRSREEKPFLGYAHRRLGDTDAFFVANRVAEWRAAQLTFRVEGRRPEFWNPVNGEIAPCVDYQATAGRTSLPVRLPPNGSVFVVFRAGPRESFGMSLLRDGRAMSDTDPGANVAEIRHDVRGGIQLEAWQAGTYSLRRGGISREIAIGTLPAPLDLKGPWRVGFTPMRDGLSRFEAESPELSLWNESPDLRVRSFAGTATYQMKFSVPSGSFDHERRVVLDLGAVHDLAEIVINGKAADVLWTPPFRVDVTDLLVRGPNRLEIRVTNTWHNWRLQNRFLPVKHPWSERGLSRPPMPAGLVGPVRLVWNERRTF